MVKRDHSLDALLDLDGETFVFDSKNWVKFEVKRVPFTPERPHGLVYSLTLHDPKGQRLLGYDNAHPITEGSGPGARTRIEFDHKHKGQRVRFYEYKNAETLLSDFWDDVNAIEKEGKQ